MTSDLLRVLTRHVNHRGLVLADEASLLRESQGTSDQLRRSLAELAESGAVELLSPLPFLVLRLRSWSAMNRSQEKTGLKTRPLREAPIDARGYKHTGEVGGAGEGEGSRRGIIGEVLETLGETDATAFARLLEFYSPSLIRAALRRVSRTKPGSIRTSRTALFRYLLGKLSR
jgi:hypothetical protein